MIGLGTLINTAAVLLGGILGLFFRRLLNDRIRQTLTGACGIAVITLGLSGSIQSLISVSGRDLADSGTMMMILSLIFGGLIGEVIGIEQATERFGEWLRKKSGSEGDASFVAGFVSVSCTICIGAMAVIGPINDAIYHDYSVLIAKAILDLVIVFSMSGAYGKGCIFSAIPLLVLQGLITLLAVQIAPLLTEDALTDLSIVGNILIAGVGINLLFGKKLAVANFLPALVIAVVWGIVTGS